MTTERTFALEDIEEAMHDQTGFCLACGEQTDGMVEPDAERYKCDVCGALQVYGAEQIVLMGLVK